MAYGNNRAGGQGRAHFRQAGGTVMKFRHPYFAGAIDNPNSTVAIDEIDVSASVKLEGRFFEANQNQDSAKQTVLIDGSTVTITNKMLNGTMSIPAIPTTGEVATGDFIAGCQLIQSVGDNVGGIFTKTDFVNGKALTRVYYGVTVLRCPVDVSEGNDVAPYNVQLLYAGWIQAESKDSNINKKAIWAVGSQKGIEGFYSPYSIQNQDGNGGTQNKPLEATALAPDVGDNIKDDISAGADNSPEIEGDTGVQKKTDVWGKVVDVTSILTEEAKEADPKANTGSSANNG
jgi:hypothetical protein